MDAGRVLRTMAVMTGAALGGAAADEGLGAPGVRLEWRRAADLPDPVGLKGMYGGVSGGHVVLAGGSNFPVAATAGGKKVFHRAIFLRPADAGAAIPWTTAESELPGGLGEGASVTTPDGVVCLGGHNGTAPQAAVFVLRWNAAGERLERMALPALPEAAANLAATLAGGWIYVAGGEGPRGALGTFWRLDLARAALDPAGTRWEALPGWPGRPRFGGILAAVTTPHGEGLLWTGGLPGPARSQADYLQDALVFVPGRRTWRSVAPLPRGAVLGAAVALDAGRVLVLGGSDGHDFARMKELGERYRIPGDVLLYDAAADRWTRVGMMPLGVVGAAVVRTGDRWLLAGGEFSPGLRTPQVWEVSNRISAGRDR